MTSDEKLTMAVTPQVLEDFYNQKVAPFLNGSGATHYSTEEQVVGTWIDGKPIYQKTFVKTSDFSTDFYLADLSDADVDKIIEGCGWWTRCAEGVFTQFPYGRTEQPVNPNFDINIRYMGGIKKLRVIIGGYPISEISEIRYSLRYTKTTDA